LNNQLNIEQVGPPGVLISHQESFLSNYMYELNKMTANGPTINFTSTVNVLPNQNLGVFAVTETIVG